MMPMQDRLALHTWSLDTTPLRETLQAARAGGWNGVELRRVDFLRSRQHGMSDDEVVALVKGSGLVTACVGTETGLLFAEGAESERLFGVLEETCRNAAALDCPLLMLAPGQNTGTLETAGANFRRVGEVVSRYGLRIALEFNSVHPVIDSLAAGRKVVEYADHPACGLLLDAYHLEKCGDGGRSFADMPAEEIFAFQFSDVPHDAVRSSAGAAATDRLPPGAGRVRWADVFGLLRDKQYSGYLSYEGPNPAAWARSPVEVAREAAVATRRVLADVE